MIPHKAKWFLGLLQKQLCLNVQKWNSRKDVNSALGLGWLWVTSLMATCEMWTLLTNTFDGLTLNGTPQRGWTDRRNIKPRSVMKKEAWSEPIVTGTFILYSAATVLILLWNLEKAECLKTVIKLRLLYFGPSDKQLVYSHTHTTAMHLYIKWRVCWGKGSQHGFEGQISFWMIQIRELSEWFFTFFTHYCNLPGVFSDTILNQQQKSPHPLWDKLLSPGCLFANVCSSSSNQHLDCFSRYTKSRYHKTSAVKVWHSLKRHKSLRGRSQPNSAE